MFRLSIVAFAVGCSTVPAPLALSDEVEARFEEESCALRVPLDHATVQEAIDAAADGDTVCVAPGTYPGPIEVVGRELRIVGAGPDRTFLDGDHRVRVLTLAGGSLELDGLAIVRGAASGGAGILVEDSWEYTFLSLHRVSIEDNHATGGGGGLSAGTGSRVRADHVRVRGNSGAGTGGISISQGFLEADHLQVIGNHAWKYGAGGLFVGRAGAHIENSVIARNWAAASGGGAVMVQWGGTMRNTLFAENTSEALGGGVYLGGYSGNRMENVVFARNHAVDGGAVFASAPGIVEELVNAVFVENSAHPGGASVFSGDPEYHTEASFSHSVFWRNAGPLVSPELEDPVGMNGNFEADPQFVRFGPRVRDWDLHLEPGSPLIDAGDPALLDPDGTVSDIGLYGGPAAED